MAAQHTLTLDNGDRLSGRLEEIRGGTWTFAFSGTKLKLPVARVTGLHTEEPIGLRLADGTVLGARVEPAADSLTLILPDSSVRVAHPTQLEAVGPADDLPALRRRGLVGRALASWIVTGSLGYSDKRGNSRARGIAAGFQLTRKAEQTRVDLGASGTREESEPPEGGPLETTVSKAQEFAQFDWYVRPRVFLTVGMRHEQDKFQDIDLRSTYSGGVGFQVVATKQTDLRVTLNGGWRREDFVSGGEASTVIVGLATAFRHTFGPVALEWRISFDPRARDFDDYRLVSRSTITTRLYGGLGLRFEVLDEYNNHPRPGVRHNDLLTTTTVTYSLGK